MDQHLYFHHLVSSQRELWCHCHPPQGGADPSGGMGEGQRNRRATLTHTFPQVKWVFSALLQSTPQALHDYANVLQPRA